jgi:hypothetical protein
MKMLLTVLLMACSTSILAATVTCKMHSRGNETDMKLSTQDQKASVQMGTSEAEICDLEESTNFPIHVRCGTGDDAMYFAVKGTGGKVYASFGTVALLKACKSI